MIKYKKYQTAGTIYTDDPKRAQAYQDSLTLYNNVPQVLDLSNIRPNSEKEYYKNELSRMVSNGDMYKSDLFDNPKNEKAYYKLTSLNKKEPRAVWTVKNDKYEQKFPKPIQPVKYRNPKVLKKQQELINLGYDIKPDGIWGPKSEEAWKQYQNRNTPIQSTPAPVVNNPQIVNTPVQVVEPKSPSFKYTKYNGQTYDMSPSMEKEVDKAMYNRQSGGNLKYQVAGRTQLNKDFIEGISNSKPKKTINKPDLYNNPTEIDNTKVNYQQVPIIYKTYPQNVNGKTVNVPTNQGTITQGNPDDFKDTLYNRSKSNKTFNNLANNLIVPVTNIAGGLEGANLIKQGVKNIIKRIPKKVPLKVNDISNEIRLYNKNFNNNPTDNYKAIIDKGTNPIISKDIPDEPYPRMLYRKYTHGNPHDIHRFTLKNKPLNGNANNIIQKNNFKSDSGEDFFGRINKEHYPGIMKNYRKTAKRPIIINDEIPGMAYQRHIPRRTTKLSNKLGQDHSLQLKRNYPDDGIENNIEKYKFYKDLERYNIDISRINNIKNYLDKFDIIE